MGSEDGGRRRGGGEEEGKGGKGGKEGKEGDCVNGNVRRKRKKNLCIAVVMGIFCGNGLFHLVWILCGCFGKPYFVREREEGN